MWNYCFAYLLILLKMSQMFPSYSLNMAVMSNQVSNQNLTEPWQKKTDAFGDFSKNTQEWIIYQSTFFVHHVFFFGFGYITGWGRSRCWSCWKTWSLLPGLNNWTAGMVGGGVGWNTPTKHMQGCKECWHFHSREVTRKVLSKASFLQSQVRISRFKREF